MFEFLTKKDFFAGVGKKIEGIEKRANQSPKTKKNSLEPQKFKRVSLGGTAACKVELLVAKTYCIIAINKKIDMKKSAN